MFPVADAILQNSMLYCIMYVQEFDLIKGEKNPKNLHKQT